MRAFWYWCWCYLVGVGLDARVVGQSFKLDLGHVVSHLDLLCVKYDLNYRVISFSSGYEGMVLLFCLREFGRESYLVY